MSFSCSFLLAKEIMDLIAKLSTATTPSNGSIEGWGLDGPRSPTIKSLLGFDRLVQCIPKNWIVLEVSLQCLASKNSKVHHSFVQVLDFGEIGPLGQTNQKRRIY